jgi:uncharacterized protein YsxB (DUF464 family)
MIEAIIYTAPAGDGKDAPDAYTGYEVRGHAGAARKGSDIVCAAVSILAQTALKGLGAHLSKEPAWKIDERGSLSCRLPEGLSAGELQAARIVIHTLELGLEMIEQEYPQYLKVAKRRWNKCCSD